jgi:hypothetical protein
MRYRAWWLDTTGATLGATGRGIRSCCSPRAVGARGERREVRLRESLLAIAGCASLAVFGEFVGVDDLSGAERLEGSAFPVVDKASTVARDEDISAVTCMSFEDHRVTELPPLRLCEGIPPPSRREAPAADHGEDHLKAGTTTQAREITHVE